METPKDNTLHSRTSEVIRRLKGIDNRLGKVTTNICGSCPEVSGDIAKPIEEYLHDKFNTTDRLIQSIEMELARLENSVGSHMGMMQATQTAGY